MKTTLNILETALRTLFRKRPAKRNCPPLPTFRSGGTLVDVAGRDALDQAMEGR